MTRLVAVDQEALDKVIRHLRGHANFKRHGHSSSRSTEGADQIDALADGLEKQYDVRVDLSTS